MPNECRDKISVPIYRDSGKSTCQKVEVGVMHRLGAVGFHDGQSDK